MNNQELGTVTTEEFDLDVSTYSGKVVSIEEGVEFAASQKFAEDLDEQILKLPQVLRDILGIYETTDEKLMGFFAITCLTGALMPNAWVNYSNQTNYLALMLAIKFPPASGKGAISKLTELLSVIDNTQDTF
jgi:hypothetical protein